MLTAASSSAWCTHALPNQAPTTPQALGQVSRRTSSSSLAW